MKKWQADLSDEAGVVFKKACADLGVPREEVTDNTTAESIMLLWLVRRVDKGESV